MDKLPVLAIDLVKELERMYPDKTLKLKDISKSERQIWLEAGQRAVVDMLLTKLKQGEED